MYKNYSFSYKDLSNAYEDCLKHKRKTFGAIKFSLNVYENLIQLCDEINNRTYKISTSIAFIITYPKIREIFAADFRDRIVHHLIINELMPYFEKYFIKESFSCMKGRGVLYGVKTMASYMEKCSKNYTIPTYVLKMDIKSFFMSIDKNLLSERIEEFINIVYPDNNKKECLKWLTRMIIMHHPEENCIRKSLDDKWNLLEDSKTLFKVDKNKGMAIGNLTSQLFANFYMTILDFYIKYCLNFKYYGRYVDDFMLYHNDKEYIKRCIPKIIKFTKKYLLLDIHPNKIYLQKVTHGVKFLGADIMPNRIYCGNRTIGAFYNKLLTEYKHYKKDKIETFISSVNSYLGYMKHYSTYNMRKEILESQLLNEWKDYITIDKNYLKINLHN